MYLNVVENITYNDTKRIVNDTPDYWFPWIFQGLLSVLISLIGIPGNILSIHIMNKLKDKSSSEFMLKFLAGSDLIYVTLRFVISSVPTLVFMDFQNLTFSYIYWFLEPVSRMSLAVSTWITVILTYHRYKASNQKDIKIRKINKNYIKRLTGIIIIFCGIFHLPRFLEYSIPRTILYSSDIICHFMPRNSYLYTNKYFHLYYKYIFYSIVFNRLPLLCLTIFTVFLGRNLWLLRKKKSIRQRRNSAHSITSQKKRRNTERQITILCMWISVMFMACNIPSIAYKFLRYRALKTSMEKFANCSSNYLKLKVVAELFFLVNSSFNVFLYLGLSKKFRKAARQNVVPSCCKC